MGRYAETFYSESDIVGAELQAIENLENTVHLFIQKLGQFHRFANNDELKDFIHKQSYNTAIEYISRYALTYILNAARRAMFETVEYNYEPFIERMERAIIAHADEMLFILFDGSFANVRLDFTHLGRVEEYQNAVEVAREIGNFGLNEKNPLLGWFWEEKVYKPARESTNVPGADPGRYDGAYPFTIELRLSLIDDDKAPFWYLINYGNLNVSGMRHLFDPYPIVAPTMFVEKAEIAIRNAFLEVYTRMRRVVEDSVVESIFEILGITGFGASITNLDIALAEHFDKALVDPVLQQKIKDANVNKLTSLFTAGNIEYSARRSSKGLLYLIARDIRTNRFTSILSKR